MLLQVTVMMSALNLAWINIMDNDNGDVVGGGGDVNRGDREGNDERERKRKRERLKNNVG